MISSGRSMQLAIYHRLMKVYFNFSMCYSRVLWCCSEWEVLTWSPSWPAGHICPSYKEFFQVRWDNNILLLLNAAIYLEVSLFRWISQNAFSRETAVYKWYIIYRIVSYIIICIIYIHSFSSLSYDRSKASSKASSPHSAIQSFLLQMRVSSPFLKVAEEYPTWNT
jgi:hypothetical protein